MKYTTVKVHGVIISIAEITDTKGYTISVLETVLPTDEELEAMTDKQQKSWVKQNNKMMKLICDFMNKEI